MNAHTIQPATAQESETLCARLRAFNRHAVGEFDFTPVALAVRDAQGELLGGFLGEVYLGWLAIDVLWVDEALRGSGLGSALLLQAETHAVALGAQAAWLDTFEWQAEAFYRRHGYATFGQLDDFPRGFRRLFMRKSRLAVPSA